MSNFNGYILSYINPDTDGVCTSIAYCSFLEHTQDKLFTPIVFGKIDEETKYVLRTLSVPEPNVANTVDSNLPIILVDTHHKDQLPSALQPEKVVEIIDHHPAGDAALFYNAIIQNEEVGAAATIVAERFKLNNLIPDRKISGLLSAAIVSNTLNFIAPSTTERDRVIFEWLQTFFKIDNNFILNMLSSRSDIYAKSSIEVLNSNIKEFKIDKCRIGICQIETIDLEQFISRADLEQSMFSLQNTLNLDHIIVNGVDIIQRNSIVMAIKKETQDLLTQSIGAVFSGNFAQFSRILLRKTDFVPQIKSYILGNK